MPDFWSHQLAANSIREELINQSIADYNMDIESLALFYLGAQGPDLFYYINKFAPYKKRNYKSIGDAIHHSDPKKLLTIMIETAFKMHNKDVSAYLQGFITHYFLDAYCHPIICRLGPDSESHKRVEMDFEALCINRYWQIGSKALKRQFFTVSNRSIAETLEPYWNTVLKQMNLITVPLEDYRSGVQSLHLIEKLLVYKVIQYLPFKDVIGKLFHYNLSLLQFPKITEKLATQLEFNTFVLQYERGMIQAQKALSELSSLEKSSAHIFDYASKWIDKTFLGEDLKNVQ